MKKIILLSALDFSSCLVCASMKLFPWENCEVQINFVPIERFASTATRSIKNNDLIVGIGYKDLLFPLKKLNELRNKFLMLMPSEAEDGNEFIPVCFEDKIYEETLSLMNTIVNIANHETSDGNLSTNKSDTHDSSSALDLKSDSEIIEDLFYLQNRYLHSLRTVKSLYGQRGKIKLHRHFLAEIIKKKKDEWIDEMVKTHSFMEKRTNELIPQIGSAKNYRGIGLLSIADPYFFEENIIMASEELGYQSIAIEYKDGYGAYFVIFSEKIYKRLQYFPGKFQENWEKILYQLN